MNSNNEPFLIRFEGFSRSSEERKLAELFAKLSELNIKVQVLEKRTEKLEEWFKRYENN